jgi:ERCC4-type nuclease
MIVFHNDEDLYLDQEEMEEFCKNNDIVLAFQSTAVYLDLAKDLDAMGPLPFFKSKVIGSQAAYDYLKLKLIETRGEEFTEKITEEIESAIQKEKDESAR